MEGEVGGSKAKWLYPGFLSSYQSKNYQKQNYHFPQDPIISKAHNGLQILVPCR